MTTVVHHSLNKGPEDEFAMRYNVTNKKKMIQNKKASEVAECDFRSLLLFRVADNATKT
jgi:hypothetical protein